MSGSLIGALRVSLGLDSAQFESGVKRARGEAQKASRDMGSSFDGIGASLGRVTAGIGAVVAAVAPLAIAIVSVNREFQTLEARMKVATGGASQAAAEMRKLEEFAAQTPFSLAQVVDGFITLKNMGLDPSIEALRDYGNIAASAGKDVMMMIEAVADASNFSFERLREFGIVASQSGDKVTFLFRGVETTVDKSSTAIQGYLRGLAQQTGDTMGAMAQTIDGRMSNLGDTVRDLARTIGQLGFNDFFLKQVERLTGGIAALSLQLKGLSRIKANEGILAMMNASADEAVAAGTAEGMRSRLIGQANAAQAARIQAQQARERGQLGLGNVVTINARKAAEAAALARLRAYEAGEWMQSIVGRFPLNEKGGFGAVAAARPPLAGGSGGSSGKARAAAAKPRPTWADQARAGDFDAPVPAASADPRIVSESAMDNVQHVAMAIGQIVVDLPRISQSDIFKADAFAAAANFAEGFARSIGQAVVFSGNLGTALVNSLKAAAAELISSGLLNLLLGKTGPGGARTGGIIGAVLGVPGFAGGTSFAPGGLAMVGEQGRELVNLPRGSQVLPNEATERLLRGAAAGQDIRVHISASPDFDVRVEQIGAMAGAAGGLQVVRGIARPPQPAALG